MKIGEYIRKIPKIELHVHLEGSIRPVTLLKLAEKNQVDLPVKTLEELKKWYQFVDFPHFAELYQTISKCIKSCEDIELITKDFLENQAEQNIIHTEATFTALTHYLNNGLDFADQLKAINRAKEWGWKKYGITLGIIIDIPRDFATQQQSMLVAEWVASSTRDGVVALGLGGYEVGFPPVMFRTAFDYVRSHGVPAVVHAGETEGPASIWGALNELGSIRIGHGVRSIEDKKLVQKLKTDKIPLEICPSSNICLKVYDSIHDHPVNQLVEEGVVVTINSDDPPMFNTNLMNEYQLIAAIFNYPPQQIKDFIIAGAKNSLVSKKEKQRIINKIETVSAGLLNPHANQPREDD
ncbi:MAG: adenosine deaminase [Spirochaetes bacterium]|nr:adenosine deaminase [Spirochaetota bacterium]